jgi:pimeloyl-ACP methyl ester carboxylesterase
VKMYKALLFAYLTLSITPWALGMDQIKQGICSIWNFFNRSKGVLGQAKQITLPVPSKWHPCVIDMPSRPAIFAPGLSSNERQAVRYLKGYAYKHRAKNYPYIIESDSVYTFNFPEATSLFSMNVAQSHDIQALDNVYKQVEGDQTPLVFGVCRGASAILNWLKDKQPRVAAVVLESPFATLQDAINHVINNIPLVSWVPFISRFIHKHVIPNFVARNYDISGKRPIDDLKDISLTTPIFLYCSKQDGIVPAYSTIKLYKEFKRLGFVHVHILVLNTGRHAKILWDSDGDRLQNTLHAFYRHYNLPHNEDLARLGQVDFMATQPSIEDVATHVPPASWWHRIDA